MAGKPEVKIPISLPPGDVSGADQAIGKIDEVKVAAADASTDEAARAQQAADDVIEARKRVSDRRVADHERAIAEEKEAATAARDSAAARFAAGAAIALVAKQATALVASTLKDFRELGGELTSVQVALLETAEFASDPFGSLVESITGAQAALKSLAESNANIGKAEAVYLETLKRKNEEVAQAVRNRAAAITQGTSAAIEAETAAYERQLRVVTALADLEEAQARRADAQAIRNKADPNQVAAGAAARQAAGDAGAEDQKVAAAEQKLAAAEQLFDAATAALVEASTASAEDRARLSEEAQGAQAAVADAVAELQTVRVEAEAAKAEIATTLASEFEGLKDQASADLSAAATEAKAALEAEAKAQGENFTAGGKEALRLLTEALADGIISPEEIAAVRTAIAQVTNSQNLHNAEVLRGFEGLLNAFTANQQISAALNTKINNALLQIEGLKAKVYGGG